MIATESISESAQMWVIRFHLIWLIYDVNGLPSMSAFRIFSTLSSSSAQKSFFDIPVHFVKSSARAMRLPRQSPLSGRLESNFE
jgi:hypothetical protein